jgi:hypothetical protein
MVSRSEHTDAPAGSSKTRYLFSFIREVAEAE